MVFIAPKDFEDVLAEELGPRVRERHGRLFLADGAAPAAFAQNQWFEPKTFKFKSISQAADHLRSIQRNWWLHSVAAHRRAELIREQLPPLKPKPLTFLASIPVSPLGSWCLLDEETLLYSARCSSPFPDGEVEFIEDKVGPPSRAYLKLWELFTLQGRHPAAGERVIDLGSSPGGWTWVLDQLGCEVLSVDKAPLDDKLKLSPRVKFINESAFALSPEDYPQVQWLFSDVICYPDRLLKLVQAWEKFVPNLVCTIKFQGPTDFATLEGFKKIPGARLMHLSCNKHELTWWRFK